jgi:eukaryotic-like serine/threonine-protein kinase
MTQPGQVLLNKYRIERVLGRGGMGTVALAHHLHLDTPVAIKFLNAEMLDKATVVKRFLREAQAAARLQSEHVCRVSDVGVLDSGAPYMVMELMQGMDLHQMVLDHGRPPPGELVDYMLQACEALAEAHAHGIVHRDLKPGNLFLARRPDGSSILKVLDFGISKAGTTLDEEITHTHAVLGTPAYMSPEQMRSAKHVDARSDVWALGVVLYELLNGSRPFRGRAFTALCLSVTTDPTPAMEVTVPPGLEQAVARCLHKDPAARYQNVAELAHALAPFAATTGTAPSRVERCARLLGIATPTTPVQPVEDAGATSPEGPPTTLGGSIGEMTVTSAWPSKRRLGLIAAVAVILVLAGAGTIVVLGSADRADRAAATPTGAMLANAGSDEPDTNEQVTARSIEAAVLADASLSADAADAGTDAVAVEPDEPAATTPGTGTTSGKTSGRGIPRSTSKSTRKKPAKDTTRTGSDDIYDWQPTN